MIREREIFLRPSPIERMGKFAEKNWIWAAGLFLAWCLWALTSHYWQLWRMG